MRSFHRMLQLHSKTARVIAAFLRRGNLVNKDLTIAGPDILGTKATTVKLRYYATLWDREKVAQ